MHATCYARDKKIVYDTPFLLSLQETSPVCELKANYVAFFTRGIRRKATSPKVSPKRAHFVAGPIGKIMVLLAPFR